MSREFQDHYTVLGVAPSATTEEIKRAYLARAREVHPDLQKTRLTLKTEWTKEVNEAYQVLGDPARRARYDRERAAREGPVSPDDGKAPAEAEPPASTGGEAARADENRAQSATARPRPTAARPSREPQTERKSFRVIVLVLAAGAGLLGGVLVMLLTLRSPPQREQPRKCVLTLRSVPFGASVNLGREPIGKTPVRFEHEAGDARLLFTFELSGYETQHQVALCHEGQTARVTARMQARAQPRPRPRPRPTADGSAPSAKNDLAPNPYVKATPLSKEQRARLKQADRLLRERRYRKANLATERLLRDLPRAHRWRAHHLLFLGYCGLQELANARSNFSQLPSAIRRSALRRCKKLGVSLTP